MRIQAFFLIASTAAATFASGCATEVQGLGATSEPVSMEASGEDALAATPRALILDAARADLKANDLKGAALYRRGASISFVVNKFVLAGDTAYLQARAMKRTVVRGRNVDAELTAPDYAGSYVATAMAEGYFDGPTYLAVFEKKAGRWAVAVRGPGRLASRYSAFGPTDVPFYHSCDFTALPPATFWWDSAAERDAECASR